MNVAAVTILTLVLVLVPAPPARGAVGPQPGAGADAGERPGTGTGSPRGPVPGRPPEPGRLPEPGGAPSGANAAVPVAGGSAGYLSPVAGTRPPAGIVARFDRPESRWGAGHRGVDLATETGARVRSPGPGSVTFAGDVAGRGVVVVTHPDGLRSSLEPVDPSVPVGTAVAAGDAVGTVQDSASNHCAPGTCVHWGVRRGDRYLDPLHLLHRPVIVLLPDG